MRRLESLVLALALASAVVWSATAPSAAEAAHSTVSSFTAVSCPSNLVCFASGTAGSRNVVLDTKDGGGTWHLEDVAIGVSAMECPSPSICVAGGLSDKVLVTRDGGTTWSAETVSTSLAEVQALSCPTSTDCWLTGIPKTGGGVDVTVYRWSHDGSSWLRLKTPKLIVPMNNFSGIDCANRDDCIVTGYGVLRTRDGGAKWTSITPKDLVLDAITCVSKSRCVALSNVTSAVPSNASGSIYTTGDAGSTWLHRLTGKRVFDLDSVSCPQTNRCVSVGGGYTLKGRSAYSLWGAVETTTNGGRSWAQRRVTSVSYLVGIACLTGTSSCTAVGTAGQSGVILKSTNDGVSWSQEPLP